MMPSRGLHVAKSQTPTLIRQQCRNLSSTPRPPRPHLRLSHKTNAILQTARPWTRSIPAAATSIPTIRHASWFSWGKQETAPAAAAQSAPPIQASQAAPATPPPPPPEPISAATSSSASSEAASTALPPHPNEASPFPDLDTVLTTTDPAAPIANIPEGIGYLKQIGLDYGTGPTSGVEWVLEHIHIYTGLPWWASILATGVSLRLVLFPLFVKQSDSMARQNALSSILKPINERITQAQKESDTQGMMLALQQSRHVRRRAGIRMRDQLIPVAIQGVLGYCGFKLMSAASKLPVPGFQDGGFLWLSDLTMTDGYLLMPLLMAVTMHMMVRLGGESGAQAAAQLPRGMKQAMMYVMPALIFIFTAWQPGSVCLWFASTGIVGITQGQVLKNARVREWLNIAPLYVPTDQERDAGVLAQMLGSRKPSTSSSNQSGPAAPGKNAQYMRPTYQTPTLNRAPGEKTIDTTLVTPNSSGTSTTASEMIQPGTKSGPTLYEKWQNLNKNAQDQLREWGQRGKPQTPEEHYRARAKAYEERAKQRGR